MNEPAAHARLLDVQVAAMSLQWGNPHGTDLPAWLARVKEMGYHGVSGFAWWGWQDHLDDPRGFGRMLNDAGLALASVNVSVVGDMARYEPVLAFMQALNCQTLVCIAGHRDKTDLATEVELMNGIGQLAGARGIRACYHHHTGGVAETRAETDAVLARVDASCVWPMLECGHATKDFVDQPVKERAAGFARDYGDRLALVEFKDWHEQTDLNTPVGEGACDYEAVRDALVAASYRGWVVMEQNGHTGPSNGRDADTCAQISRRFIRNLVGV